MQNQFVVDEDPLVQTPEGIRDCDKTQKSRLPSVFCIPLRMAKPVARTNRRK